MTDDNIISFRKAKKQVKRTRKERQASENRVKFGRSRPQKEHDIFSKARFNRHVDDHKRDKPE